MRNIYIVSIMTCARASQGPTCLLCRRAPAEKAFPGLQLERRTKLDDAIDPERRRAWRRPAQLRAQTGAGGRAGCAGAVSSRDSHRDPRIFWVPTQSYSLLEIGI
jgi:hypothetical protein